MLTLSNQYAAFEAGLKSDVFFDNVNKKICTVRSNGALGVTTKGLCNEDLVLFRTRDTGKINSLNFSTDGLIAAIHRVDSNLVNFVFLDDKLSDSADKLHDYSQPCKQSDARIYGIEWVNDKQVVYVTDRGLELYQFNHKRKTVKIIRSECFEPFWYVYYPPSQLLICSSGVTCSILNLFIIQNGVIHKLPRFEADFGCSSLKTKLTSKDVTMASIYGKLYILVQKHSRIEPAVERLNLYLLNNVSEPPKLAHSLLLNLKGAIGVHVVDNLFSTQSLLFDICLIKPAVEIHSFASSTIQISSKLRSIYDTDDIVLYKQSWALFSPNLVADARFGIFTKLELCMENIGDFITNNVTLLEFIANRSNSKQIFLRTFKRMLATKALTIRQTAEIFSRIVSVSNMACISTKDSLQKLRIVSEPFYSLRIDYNSVAQEVLFNLKEEDNPKVDMRFLAAITLEFLLVVRRTEMTSLDLDLVTELLLHALIEAGEFSKLKQLLQYRVLDDSKLLPLDLIALGAHRKDFDQIAVDILRRQGKFRRIAEHRLSQRRPIDALRCLRDHKIDLNLCLSLLESAWATGCRQTKYTVYTTLRDVRKLPYFETLNEQLEKYTCDFKLLFNNEELEEAERRFRLAAISGSTASMITNQSVDLDESIDTTSVNSRDDQQLDLAVAPGAGAT